MGVELKRLEGREFIILLGFQPSPINQPDQVLVPDSVYVVGLEYAEVYRFSI